MGKKSAPPPPDFVGQAKQQGESQSELLNQQTWANRANQNGPQGSVNWSQQVVKDPVTGKDMTQWTQNTTLNPELQRGMNAQQTTQANQAELLQRMQGNLAGTLGTPMSTAGMQGWGTGPQAGNLQATTTGYAGINPQATDTSRMGNYGDYRQRAEDAIYSSATSRLDPQWQQQQGDLETQLAQRGITRNSAAFEREMKNLSMNKNDAYAQARQAAITGGGAEAERNFGMDQGARNQQLAAQQQAYNQDIMSGKYGLEAQQQMFQQQQAAGAQNFGQTLQQAQYENSLRGQQFGEEQAIRNQGLNEYNSLSGGNQISAPQFGNYTQAGQGQAADIYGATQDAYQGQMDAWGQKNAQRTSNIGSAAGMAAAYFI